VTQLHVSLMMIMMMMMMMMMMKCMNYAVSLTSVGFSIKLHGGFAVKLGIVFNFMVNELHRFVGSTAGDGILLCFPT
jgi:hypothetical protein